jgi:hypothetical protein
MCASTAEISRIRTDASLHEAVPVLVLGRERLPVFAFRDVDRRRQRQRLERRARDHSPAAAVVVDDLILVRRGWRATSNGIREPNAERAAATSTVHTRAQEQDADKSRALRRGPAGASVVEEPFRFEIDELQACFIRRR